MLNDHDIERIARRVADLLADEIATPKLSLDQQHAAKALGVSVRSLQRMNLPAVYLDGAPSKPLYAVETLQRLVKEKAGDQRASAC